MYTFRIILGMLFGFFLPILLSVYAIFSLFDSSLGVSTRTAARDLQSGEGVEEFQPESVKGGTSFAVVRSDQGLDPELDRAFFLSFVVRFDQLPTVGFRHNIISKYASKEHPYPGWAIALRSLETSMRPEVYVKGKSGSGGWFTFDRINIRPGGWYSFSLLLKPKEFMALYVQEVGGVGEATQSEHLDTGVRFLGGQDISAVDITKTASDIYLGTIRQGPTGFTGEVGLVLLAHPGEINPAVEQLRKFLQGGPVEIAKKLLPEDIQLWVTDKGKDESRYARMIEFTGRPSWQTNP